MAASISFTFPKRSSAQSPARLKATAPYRPLPTTHKTTICYGVIQPFAFRVARGLSFLWAIACSASWGDSAQRTGILRRQPVLHCSDARLALALPTNSYGTSQGCLPSLKVPPGRTDSSTSSHSHPATPRSQISPSGLSSGQSRPSASLQAAQTTLYSSMAIR